MIIQDSQYEAPEQVQKNLIIASIYIIFISFTLNIRYDLIQIYYK